MNLLAGTVEGGTLRLGALALPFAGAGSEREVLVGVRPAALHVQGAGSPGTIPGTVAMVEHIGAESLVTVRLEGVATGHEEEGAREEVIATLPGYSTLRAGERVGLLPSLDDAVVFSARSGLRVGRG